MFAAPWLHRRVGCQVVVTVRDPVATVSSWRRLGWTPRLAELLAQPDLVRDRLTRFVPDLTSAVAADGDGGVGPASLLWRVIYGTVADYRRELPALEVVRYAIDLRSMTRGKGSFARRFSHYEELPSHMAAKVIEEVSARK